MTLPERSAVRREKFFRIRLLSIQEWTSIASPITARIPRKKKVICISVMRPVSYLFVGPALEEDCLFQIFTPGAPCLTAYLSMGPALEEDCLFRSSHSVRHAPYPIYLWGRRW